MLAVGAIHQRNRRVLVGNCVQQAAGDAAVEGDAAVGVVGRRDFGVFGEEGVQAAVAGARRDLGFQVAVGQRRRRPGEPGDPSVGGAGGDPSVARSTSTNESPARSILLAPGGVRAVVPSSEHLFDAAIVFGVKMAGVDDVQQQVGVPRSSSVENDATYGAADCG